jgi:molybdopterin/thiamine biosynthesis adenylyltransferase
MFDYQQAFSRNIGWVTQAEQARLRSARVAIAGLGGVGGAHALTLARLGIAHFSLADFDEFGVHNFNRQAGAFMSTVGQAKAATMARMIRDINPEADIRLFEQGVTPDNVGDFLAGASVYVDGIDFFAMPARRLLFETARRLGLPAVTAAPLGIGVSLLYFDARGLSFEDYFRLEGHGRDEQAVSFKEQRGPSTVMSCDLCAGLMGASVMKLLLGRGTLRAAPWALQFDAYHQRLRYTWRPGGNAHPLQWLLLKLIRPRLGMATGAAS